jgi:hypothetical protein
LRVCADRIVATMLPARFSCWAARAMETMTAAADGRPLRNCDR